MIQLVYYLLVEHLDLIAKTCLVHTLFGGVIDIKFKQVLLFVKQFGFMKVFLILVGYLHLYLSMTLIAMPKPLLFLIVYIFAVDDIFSALRAEYLSTKPAMVPPTQERYEFLAATVAGCGLLVLDPQMLRSEHGSNLRGAVHVKICIL